MLEFIKSKIDPKASQQEQFNKLRELMQALILSILDELGYFKNIAFIGGTALRIIHKVNRYSEDLDFSLINKDGYEFNELIDSLIKELALRNLSAEMKMKKKISAVSSTFIKFEGLLSALGLSPLQSEKLSIKFEIDENPPLGYNLETSLLTDFFTYSLTHFDLSSLYAGKINAILSREYAKGRDFFDFLWYCSQNIEPNYVLLENSLKQHGINIKANRTSLNKLLQENFAKTDFAKIREELEIFVINQKDLRFYTEENFSKLLV